ncbi:hypothetical protein UFOVP703_74 [uncultured Caudovirales phage]|uniref:Uncharacterized protein n=1 Tax=uncultured Caudovirales phage TaxID=2100421 RepID=A0A6J5NNE4_9CAUD|nr:hypothetical protein UFOVP703_74 [uncultured Caudovirales phage]
MTNNPDRPSIPERYTRALESSHLEVEGDHQGDVDVLIAAGWVKETLGTALYRARSEFDAVNKRELALVSTSLIARVVVLSKMTSLMRTREAVGRWALKQATVLKFMQPDAAVYRLSGQALDVWLDAACHHCGGKGFTGGYGLPQVLCKHCGATGSRRYRMGTNNQEHEFGRALLTRMDAKCDRVAKAMGRYLRKDES